MIHLRDIRYVRLGCSDLDEAVRFATEILGLELVARDRRLAWLRGDNRDHNLCYELGDPKRHVVGFEVAGMGELDAAANELDKAGLKLEAGSAEDCELRRVAAFARFRDPTGNVIDLAVKPQHSGVRYFPSRDAGITDFSHVGLRTTGPERDEAFWTKVCNARVSDWIGKAPLLRIDRVHHKIALFPSTFPGVQHVNFQVQSVDDIMRSFYFLTGRNVRIVFGPGRHPTSGAIFLYFQGPDGMVFEYSTGVRLIDDETNYRPRAFPFQPSSFCMWGSKPDIPEFRS